MLVPGSSRLARQSACLPSSAVKLLGGGPRQGPAPRPRWAASAGQVPEMPSMASTLPVEERSRHWRAFW
jgi:hypothetical protein